MNETVAKIVELLFQDVEMNDEVKAIHDEVMDNCQERFGDLLNRGLSEDEAIAAVVESLKGMEEVLAGYPRKSAKAAEKKGTDAYENIVFGGSTFSAESLRRLSVNLQSEDVTIEPSPDNQAHVIRNGELDEDDADQPCIWAELVGGELRVSRTKPMEKTASAAFSWNGDRLEVFGKELKLENLGVMLGKIVRNVQVGFDYEERVCIQVPASVRLERVQVQTSSGDVRMDGLTTDELDISSRSGDLSMELPSGHMLRKAELHTTSGDIEARLAADRAVVQSMSGDIRYTGAARVLDVSSTSGDVTVEQTAGGCAQCMLKSVSGDVSVSGAVQAVKVTTTSGDIELNTSSITVGFTSVSGDVEMALRGDGLREIDGHTTSGDVNIRLPEGVREADISFHTVSGDVRQSVASVSGAPLRIALKTVSGGIYVR